MMLLTLQYIPQTVFFFLLGNNETASRRKDRKFRLPTMQWPTKVKTSQNRFTFTGLAILVQTERTTKQSRDYPFFPIRWKTLFIPLQIDSVLFFLFSFHTVCISTEKHTPQKRKQNPNADCPPREVNCEWQNQTTFDRRRTAAAHQRKSEGLAFVRPRTGKRECEVVSHCWLARENQNNDPKFDVSCSCASASGSWKESRSTRLRKWDSSRLNAQWGNAV